MSLTDDVFDVRAALDDLVKGAEAFRRLFGVK